MGESIETSLATRQRTKSTSKSIILSVSTTPTIDERLVIHPHSLFEIMIPFNNDAPLPSTISATLLNNPLYNLKLVRSVVPIPDRQFMMRKNMVNSLNELIDLNLKVNIIIVCFFEA